MTLAHTTRRLLTGLTLLVAAACTRSGTPLRAAPQSAVCAAARTPIFEIQGRTDSSPLAGRTVTTQGVVVADFEGAAPALQGFYLQDPVGDGESRTSDGIFVYNGDADSVSLGDLVRVTGVVEEANRETRITRVSELVRCGQGVRLRPVSIRLPIPDEESLEQYEGMLVRFDQPLTVTELFQLGRFGQLVLSSSGRQSQPTNLLPPGPDAMALQREHLRNRIVLDDASLAQNPDPIVFARNSAALSANNTVRAGDRIRALTGVLTHTWGGHASSGVAYRVRPVSPSAQSLPRIEAANPRSDKPEPVGGTLRVSAYNVLNYFNSFGNTACTLGDAGDATGCRGAASREDFERQAAKIVAAIRALDPDILGIMEIENDGYGNGSAIADLVARLNATSGADRYAFIHADSATGARNALGTDAIKVGLLYKPSRVTPVGATAVLASPTFVNGGDREPRSRPSLAQAFSDHTGETLVVSVNHFKSKGGGCDQPDTGDGQGHCNTVRTNAARALAEWLESDPTGVSDPDVLIIGDLNAYAMEDPLSALKQRGYINVVSARGERADYSYGFDGLWGSLDHALASPTLAAQLSGVTTWHINADEPSVLGYESAFKSASQRETLYAPTPFRSSDHDPILLGFTLRR
jgi:predicted extracellular nuclease